MAKCGTVITTGYVGNNILPCGPTATAPVVASPGKTILFSPETPYDTIYSATFTVTPGEAILIDAYNMPEQQNIYVNRVVKSTTGPTTGNNCDPCAMSSAYGTEGVIVFRERMTLGRGYTCWKLRKEGDLAECTTEGRSVLQLIIAVPGTYELELEDSSMLGDLEVEYMSWRMELTPWLPKEYFAGVLVPFDVDTATYCC